MLSILYIAIKAASMAIITPNTQNLSEIVWYRANAAVVSAIVTTSSSIIKSLVTSALTRIPFILLPSITAYPLSRKHSSVKSLIKFYVIHHLRPPIARDLDADRASVLQHEVHSVFTVRVP